MSAIETLLTGLIDYAGLFPPAALDMRTALRNYLEYRSSRHAFALGRFIVDASRLEELRECASSSISQIPLSVILGAHLSADAIYGALDRGLTIESIELKSTEVLNIPGASERLPLQLDRYFEIPVQNSSEAIAAIAAAGARATLRTGGVVPEAFPPPADVVEWLRVAADRRVPFKATAGLHHPIRSRHRLTYASDSPGAMMHGFLNLFCAAALLFHGAAAQAEALLEEEDPTAFRIMPDCLAWRSNEWTAEQVSTIRLRFFTSFGSCSFLEPLEDLEALGWL